MILQHTLWKRGLYQKCGYRKLARFMDHGNWICLMEDECMNRKNKIPE
jgi:hypothetical protein